MKRQFIVTIVTILLVLDITFRLLGKYAPEFHVAALEVCNIIMASLSLAAYYLVNKQIADRPNAFVRGVYSASLLKLMVSMVAALVYIFMNREHIHKGSVFVMFGIYAVYSAAETILLTKTARTQKQSSTAK
jgi:hypothetical protein